MADPTGQTAQSLYVPGFTRNLNLAPQQTKSRLIGYVDADLAYAEKGTFFNADDVGTHDPSPVIARVPASPSGFVDVTRRYGAFKGFNDGVFIDSEDKARQLEDPTNQTMMAMMAGLNRARDVAIINGALGPYQYQDLNGNYQTGSANANVIASNDSSASEAENIAAVQNSTTNGYGLTVGKLIEAKTYLDNSELDEADPAEGSSYVFACTSNQIGDLLKSIPVTNAFYNDARALHAGSISDFMGFHFIRMPTSATANPLPKANYTRKCIAFHKRAIMYRGRSIETTRVTQRPDFSFRWYAYYEFEHGAFRHYDQGVWEVDCDEKTTGYT